MQTTVRTRSEFWNLAFPGTIADRKHFLTRRNRIHFIIERLEDTADSFPLSDPRRTMLYDRAEVIGCALTV